MRGGAGGIGGSRGGPGGVDAAAALLAGASVLGGPSGLTVGEVVTADPRVSPGLARPVGTIVWYQSAAYWKLTVSNTGWLALAGAKVTVSGAATSAITLFTGGQGDRDRGYELYALLENASAVSDVVLQIKPNNLATNQLEAGVLATSTGAVVNGTNPMLYVGSIRTGGSALVRATITARSGRRRWVQYHTTSLAASGVLTHWTGGCVWDETPTEITELILAGDTANIAVGSEASLYRTMTPL